MFRTYLMQFRIEILHLSLCEYSNAVSSRSSPRFAYPKHPVLNNSS